MRLRDEPERQQVAPGFVPGPGNTLTDLLADERATRTSDPANEYSVEEVFSYFKQRRLEGVVKPADAETHLDLAIATPWARPSSPFSTRHRSSGSAPGRRW